MADLPWEDFQPAATSSPPWEDFKVQPAETAVQQAPSVLQQIGQGFTPRGLANSVGRLFHGAEELVSGGVNAAVNLSARMQGLPTYAPEQQLMQPGRPILPIPAAHDPTTAPIDAGILQTLEGFTTPGAMATIPLAAGRTLLNKIVQAMFASQMAQGAGESFAVAADPAAPSRQRMLEGTKGVLAGGMGLGLAKSMTSAKPTVPSGLRPTDFTEHPADWASRGETAPAGMQLPAPRPVTKYVTDPLGQTIDISQLSPREFTELMRGPKEYVPREQVVRPAQAPPVVIGEQAPTVPEMRSFRPAPEIEQPVVPNKPPVEPSGGEVSFRSPAAAEAIPSAGQAVQQAKAVQPIKAFRGEVDPTRSIQLSPDIESGVHSLFLTDSRKNAMDYATDPSTEKFGQVKEVELYPKNPLVVDAQGKPWGEVQDLKSAKDAGHDVVIFKNVGDNADPMSKALTTSYAVLDTKVFDKPKQSQGLGQSAPRGMQTKAAQERASKARGETGAVFPKGDEGRPSGVFALSGPRMARTPKDIGFTDTSKAVDAQQLYNRLRNKVPPREWEFYKDVLPQTGKISPDEAAKMMEDAGPKVEVKVYGQQGRNNASQQELGNALHELDTLGYTANLIGGLSDDVSSNISRGSPRVPPRAWELYDRIEQLRSTIAHESTVQPTSAYDTVSPKSTAEFPVERVDVVLPLKKAKSERLPTQGTPYTERTLHTPEERPMWQPDMLHEQYPNTLGWAAVQYDKLPSGEKVAHVFEVQSRWGQDVRRRQEKIKEQEGSLMSYEKNLGHPLLADHQRLILKATIEEAKKKGVKKIVLSDAETAMMSEGHDQVRPGRGEMGQVTEIPQEQGMRLNYDSILPKIMEELTGVKGERVELGEHKNAVEKQFESQDPNFQTLVSELERRLEGQEQGTPAYEATYARLENLYAGKKSTPRSNLIFKNPDGTPKTSVSGLVYDLSKVPEQKPSLFEKDKPAERGTRMYMAPLHVFDPDFWRSTPKKGLVGGVQKLGPYSDYVKRANSPQGLGNIPYLGKLFDPRAKKRVEFEGGKLKFDETSPAERALIAHQMQVHDGTQMTALWLETRKGVKRAFETDKDGQVTLADGSKGYMEDVIRRELTTPGSQPITPLQKQFIEWWKKQWQQVSAELTKEGVKFFKDEEGNKIKVGSVYFPRPSIGKKGVKTEAPAQAGRVIGAKQFFQHQRKHQTEEAGAKEVIYEPDEYNRVGRLLNAAYRAIADVRLANDPVLKPTKVKGRPTYLEEQMVFQPAFQGKIFDVETAKTLKSYYRESLPRWLKGLQYISDTQKTAQFTLDVSAPLNQGLPLLAMNPLRWTKATLTSYKALLSDKALKQYLDKPENLKAAQSIVSNGGSIAHLYDFLQGAKKGSLLAGLPGVRHSARSMATFLSVAKIELYKAFEPLAKEKGWDVAEMVEAIDNTVMSGRMESIGVSPGRAAGERLFLNAPSYIRGASNLVAMAIKGGPAAKRIARQALISLATAVSLQALAVYLYKVQQGEMKPEDIEKRFDIRSTEFLRVPMDLSIDPSEIKRTSKPGTGEKYLESNQKLTNVIGTDRIEVSYGNFFLSLARLIGDTVEVAQGKELKPGIGNPWLRFSRYRLAPLPSTALQVYSGQDFRGEPVGVAETLGKSITPIPLEPKINQMLKGGESDKQVRAEMLGQTFGLNVYPESYSNKRERLQDEGARQMGKEKFSELSFPERRKVEKAIQPSLDRNKVEPSARQRASAQEATSKRGQTVQAGLSPENQELLSSAGLKIAGYEVTKEQAGSTVRLTKDEQDQLASLYTKELDRRLNNLRASGRTLTKERLEVVSKASRDKAWGEIRRQARGGKATVVAE